MSRRYKGGVISATAPVPTGPYLCGTAKGIWTLPQQMQARAANIWPIAGNVQPSSNSYTTAGTYTWVAPVGVTSASVVAIGGGAGGYASYSGAGGELRYINNTAITPGNSYTVVVGAGGCHFFTGNQCHGKASTFSSVIQANGGGIARTGATPQNNQRAAGFGGTGYLGGAGQTTGSGGGGGAGGYSGCGGNGGLPATNGSAGSGGSGGGGAGSTAYCGCVGSFRGGGGGGTGLFGLGSSGSGGTYTPATNTSTGGGGGSSGIAGYAGSCTGGCTDGKGGLSGGGGGSSGNGNIAGYGANGGVRIVWPGTTRTFPSTCVGAP